MNKEECEELNKNKEEGSILLVLKQNMIDFYAQELLEKILKET